MGVFVVVIMVTSFLAATLLLKVTLHRMCAKEITDRVGSMLVGFLFVYNDIFPSLKVKEK